MAGSKILSSDRFQLSIEQIDVDNCMSIVGLTMNTQKIAIDHGNQSEIEYRKGRTYASDITFIRLFKDAHFFKWFKECQTGNIKKRSASIICKDDEDKEALRINLFGCWPIAWDGPDFNAEARSGEPLKEAITLAIENVEIDF